MVMVCNGLCEKIEKSKSRLGYKYNVFCTNCGVWVSKIEASLRCDCCSQVYRRRSH